MTLAAQTYWEFWVTRAVTGMSIGGATPLIYSMVGDLYNDELRGKVSAFVTVFGSLGTFIGCVMLFASPNCFLAKKHAHED